MSHSLRRLPLAALFVGAASLLMIAGCGVTEYESRMGHEQARLEYFDRENQLLAAPIKWPERKEEKKDEKAPDNFLPTDVFFRPPKGIEPTPQTAGQFQRLLPSPKAETQPLFQEIRILVAKGKGREAFRPEALQALGVGGSPAEKVVNVPGRKPMLLEHYRNEQGSLSVQAFLYGEENFQAVVVFYSAKPDPAVIDVSLGTLYLGYAADVQHAAYARRPAAGR